ncbi:MAG: hypothetical protein HY077_05790 [Elusimicrobia bacterium]|nr:hypothetical protein [Elusimicrobiota bacterium]
MTARAEAESRRQDRAGFAALVWRRREEAGYKSARQFYESLGGRAFFGCTYKAYLNVESGASQPQPRLVERLVAGLRLAIGSRGVREFALAYLRLLLGPGEFFEASVHALTHPVRSKGRPRAAASAADGEGEALLEHPLLLRASRAELMRYVPYLESSVRRVATRAGRGSGRRAADFVVEAAVLELLPF